MSETAAHIARRISRIRELRGMKQEALAAKFGISQRLERLLQREGKVEIANGQKRINLLKFLALYLYSQKAI